MNIAQIEKNLQKLMKAFNKESFIYELLLAYGSPKASITRLQKGNLNLSKNDGEIIWKKKLFFKEEYKEDLHITVSEIAKSIKHNERFVIVTDYKLLLAIDTKTDDKLDIELKDLPKHYDFFLPWAGMEKATHANENPADVKAAEKMAKLFDEIKKDNPDDSPEFIHGLNVFLSRLLFCFFAEDTNIFKDAQFTNAIASHTQADGSDLNEYLGKLFEVLNTANKDRKNLPSYLDEFPYVNGGLFEKKLKTPTFTRRSRQAIIDSGELDWSAINPDIFGSMIQAVITPEHRGGLGMHYTSVPNIMKVIEPLFLNDLYEAFEKAEGNPKKLNELLYRLSKLKIFDPACGSGNFLIIAYKELRRLEIKIIQHLQALQKAADGFKRRNEPILLFEIPKAQLELAASFQVELFSRIQLNQFYGIELDDFAHEIAQLSLWLAEHQMNVEFKKEFGQSNPTLPLKEAGQITHGNACRIDWEIVCPKKKDDEIYLLGNPPYLGSSLQSKQQKEDMNIVFRGLRNYKTLDYIACWFYKAKGFITNYNCEFAFVSTNSICQGEQVVSLWQNLISENLEINFAHKSFKWDNNAKSKAAVICIIVGLRNKSERPKFLFAKDRKIVAANISPYLIDYKNLYINKRSRPLSKLPEMTYGNKAVYGEHLILSDVERDQFIKKYPEDLRFIKQLVSAGDFLNGGIRWCIWINDNELSTALKNDDIRTRIERVRNDRLESKDSGANELAQRSHQFRDTTTTVNQSISIPLTTSERRDFLPLGILTPDQIASNALSVLYDVPIWIFGVVTSTIHMCWIRTVAGRLKSDYRYSSVLCYNTFPFPPISNQRKAEITQCVFRILEEREKHSEKTLAQLYDPDKMPKGLREAHRANDLVIEKCYRARPFESDEERLEFLFKLYEKMIEEEKNKGGLFEVQKKTKKKKHA
jgi:type II restriction/modification system DNA methylase subunit YeeA